MDTVQIKVKNIKCNGCIDAIQDKLSSLAQVRAVTVSKELGLVSITGLNLNKKIIAEQLAAIGYPEN